MDSIKWICMRKRAAYVLSVCMFLTISGRVDATEAASKKMILAGPKTITEGAAQPDPPLRG